jgi:hypothetical protein
MLALRVLQVEFALALRHEMSAYFSGFEMCCRESQIYLLRLLWTLQIMSQCRLWEQSRPLEIVGGAGRCPG